MDLCQTKDPRVRNHSPAAKTVTDATEPYKREHQTKNSNVFQFQRQADLIANELQ